MQRVLLGNSARRQLQVMRGAQRVVGVSGRPSCPASDSFGNAFRTFPLYLDRIRVIQGRSFTSSDDEIDYYELERWTNRVLSKGITRLGTMSVSLVDDTIKSCQQWLSSGSGVDIDSADRLLKRLELEHASGSIAAQQRTDAIFNLQQQILQSWLELSSFRMALEKSKDILDTMLQWHERGFTTHDPLPDMVQVVEACLPSHPDIAANLLLQWTEVSRPETATGLAPLFNRLLEIVIHESDVETATILLERMETLQTEHQWEDLVISDDAIDFVANGPAILELRRQEQAAVATEDTVLEKDEEEHDSLDDTDDISVKQLSDFELQAKQDRFVEFLETASRDDKSQVMEMAKQLHTLPETPTTASLYKTLMDYFIKIEDAKNATLLLRRIDIGRDFEQWELSENVFLDSLRLWVNSEHADAAWRAQELVSRMEELEIRGLVEVSTLSYNLLSEAWAKSKDPAASEKIENILSRMLDARDNGNLEWKVPNLDTFRIYLSVWPKDEDNHLAQVVSELLEMLHQGEELSKEEFSGIVENSLESLAMETPHATKKQLEENEVVASTLLRHVVSEGIPVTPTMCINLLKSQNSFGVLRELSYLESLPETAIPIDCYERAIMTLLDTRESTFSQKKGMVTRMLGRYAKGLVSANAREVEALMVRMMNEIAFTYREKATFVEGMLLVYEEWTLTDDAPIRDVKVPLQCFNIAMNVWNSVGRRERVAPIFNRILSYYEAGETTLLPSTDSFQTFLQVILSVEAPPDKTAQKATEILDRMINLYETTGNAVCRPNHACFAHVLTALSKVGNVFSAKLAVKYLRQMQSMRITPTTSAFNKVMYAIVQPPQFQVGFKFHKLCSLLIEMKQAGVEPDALTYKNMLRACMSELATPGHRQRAVSVAVDAMGNLRKLNQADAGSYGLLVMVLGRQMASEKSDKYDKVMSATYQFCYEDGCMNEQNADLFRRKMNKRAWEAAREKFKEQKASTREATSNTPVEKAM